jgi:arylsulfatase A-like enzyme
MKKFAKWLSLLSLGYLIFFVGIVYPNDYRVSFPNVQALTPLVNQLAEPAELSGTWPPFVMSMTEPEYRRSVVTAHNTSLDYLGATFGIASPYILNHSIGDYPDRIEGTHGLLVPVGGWVEFTPALAGSFQLEFKTTAIDGSPEVEIRQNGTNIGKYKLTTPPTPTDISSIFYEYLSKYWSVDRLENLRPWLVNSLEIKVNSADKLRFTCSGPKGFCFISRPIFYEKTASKKPNYLLILVDTLRQSAINKEDSPVMDRLRQSGREYTQTYAAGNLTSQSTNAFLSCQKPSDIGSLAFSYYMPALAKIQFYKKAQPSFAHFFRTSGWKTAMIGNVSVISEILGAGLDHGFEEQIAMEREAYDTPKIAGEAVRWLQDNGNKPFFLYLHFHGPHGPYRPPLKDIFKAFHGLEDLASMPALLRWLYRGEVNYTDRYIEQVLEAVKLLGLADNTKVVLTADHGEQQEMRKFVNNKSGFAETAAFFDHGATLLNDEIHIPLIFSGFDQFPRASKDGHITSNLDIGPTLLDDAEIAIPSWCDGISLESADRMEPNLNLFDRPIGSEGIRQRAVYFKDRYKYTISYSTTEKSIARENSYLRKMYGLLEQDVLIDLKADPDELHNLCEENPELLKTAKTVFDSYFHMQYLWELVLESPDGNELSVQVESGNAPIKYQGLDFDESKDKGTLRLFGNTRGIATFDHPFASPPQVRSGSTPVPVYNTYARLNLDTTDLGLPIENIGEEALLPVGSKKVAYLRKVAKTDFQARKIVAGNPQFEAILKEWGYLNDN